MSLCRVVEDKTVRKTNSTPQLNEPESLLMNISCAQSVNWVPRYAVTLFLDRSKAATKSTTESIGRQRRELEDMKAQNDSHQSAYDRPKDSGESLSSDSVDDTTDDSDSPDSSDSGHSPGSSCVSSASKKSKEGIIHFKTSWLKFKKNVSRPDDLKSSDSRVFMDSQDSSEYDSSSVDRDIDF
ncbi:Hypothetical predicted protein [Scomber scombrus]|uniref:Uncharacterized protein n=1 Tax=Scomber scombrus TaxID=13677 RepID=A0AAV1PXM8_SCOSC